MRRNSSNLLELYANPYSYNGRGFYFDSIEDYEKKYAAEYKRSRTEEYEIDFINGTPVEMTLFNLMEVSPGNLSAYFDVLEEPLTEEELAKVMYLVEYGGESFEDALEKQEDGVAREGNLKEVAAELIEEGIFEAAQYFDYESFGEDIRQDLLDSLQEDIEYLEQNGDEEGAENLRESYEYTENRNAYDLGEEYVDSVGGPSQIQNHENYVDLDLAARDMDFSGDYYEIDVNGTTYTIDVHSF